MKKNLLIAAVLFACYLLPVGAQRTEVLLEKGWKFIHQDETEAMKAEYNDAKWEEVTVPQRKAAAAPAKAEAL